MKWSITTIFLVASMTIARSQVFVVTSPHQEGYFTLDDLWRVTLINSGTQPLGVVLELKVEDAQHQLLMRAVTPNFTLLKGSNRPPSNVSAARMEYGNSNAARALRSAGRFPFGNFIICYNVLSSTNEQLLGELCQEQTVKPFSPPELVNPYNGDQITTTQPFLVWRPPFPLGETPVEYTIKLVILKNGQDAVEAIEKNAPMLWRNRLFNTFMIYPAEAPKLEYGKSYAWQVSAKAGEFELGNTDVWVFKVVSEVEAPPTGAYKTCRELKLAPDGSFHNVKQKLKFTLNNRWAAPALKYEGATPPTTLLDRIYYKIYPVGKQGSPVGTIPDVNLLSGVNRLTINLVGISGMNNGENYIMVLKEPSGATYYLEFTYFN